MGYRVINIKSINTSEEGSLSFFEANRDIYFDIKRIYYIYGAECGVERGGHAHKTLKQMLFCPYGSVLIRLENENGEKFEIRLDNPEKGLIIEACMWREMLWERDDSVLCVAASEYYDENDYIRDYSEYHNYVKQLARE